MAALASDCSLTLSALMRLGSTMSPPETDRPESEELVGEVGFELLLFVLLFPPADVVFLAFLGLASVPATHCVSLL